jgi:pilus assembly protein CpaC
MEMDAMPMGSKTDPAGRALPGVRSLAAALALSAAACGLAMAAEPASSAESGAAETARSDVISAVRTSIGKSTVFHLPLAVNRISVGNPAIADVTVINPREIYLLGKAIGSTNIMLWAASGQATIMDVSVSMDVGPLREQFLLLMPEERNLRIDTAADSVVLSGTVADAPQVDRAVALAEAYVRNINRGIVVPVSAGDAKTESSTRLAITELRSTGNADMAARVINMLKVADPQQVLLDVKVAEISKTLIDKLGANASLTQTNGQWTYSLVAGFLTSSPGSLTVAKGVAKSLGIDAQKQDSLIKVLAEPSIMAVSGQKGSFLAGGRIFIPVPQSSGLGSAVTITLEEREFGVGVAFTPTVLSGGTINLVVAPEVSDLLETGSPFATVYGITTVLPAFTVRRASTTVQLHDGQSFAIGGLIKNNVTETVKAFPALGEIPILGALFRSSEFQNDKTELVFVVTPHLVKGTGEAPQLPTEGFVQPGRAEFLLGGKLEGADGARTDEPKR